MLYNTIVMSNSSPNDIVYHELEYIPIILVIISHVLRSGLPCVMSHIIYTIT